MTTREKILQMIRDYKVIAIARGADKACLDLAQALYEGGIRLMEIAFDQKAPDSWERTAEAIGAILDAFDGKMFVGAGTVIRPDQLELVQKAGGQFIISPDCNEEIIRRTVELGLVSIPGAMTPTEILQAHRYGADFVKVFPAGALGVTYFKALRAPISHLPLLAVGGVNESNLGDFLAAGAVGVGIGGNLVKKDWIEKGEFHKITEAARLVVAAAKGADK